MTTALELGEGMMVEVMLTMRPAVSNDEEPEKKVENTGLTDCCSERRCFLRLTASTQVTLRSIELDSFRAVWREALKISSNAGLQGGYTDPAIKVNP